jgi:biopolymer transport protein ExbB
MQYKKAKIEIMKPTARLNLKKSLLLLVAAAALLPGLSHAWWNEDFSMRKKITLNTAAVGVDIKQPVAQVPVLVRLHSGNFDFASAKLDGSDIRFVAGDDKTPLKYHIEKYDALTELGLVWVQIPQLAPGTEPEFIWLYYGSEKAGADGDAKGTYDANQTAVYHFGEKDGLPQDQTAYANNASNFTAARNTGSLIGGGLTLDGKGSMTVPTSSSLALVAGRGFTVSAWIKIAAAQNNAVVFSQQDGNKSVVLGIDGNKLYAALHSGAALVETPHSAEVAAGSWHHVAVSTGKRLTLYLDGREVAALDGELTDMQGEVVVGKGFSGELDELELSNVARSADWIKAAAAGQGPDASLLTYGEDEAADSGESASYFGTILHSVTLDGWVVIGILGIMAAISWMVMLVKGLVIGQIERGNRDFMAAYVKLGVESTAALDQDDTDEDEDIQESPLLTALVGKHDHYQHSPIYRIYHAGVQQIKHRFGANGGKPIALSPQAIDAIRASLDATLVRENQKLNSLMVLLTIAISGGPFLGLLGTVVGVMITFAAIAATGDVNVAAIAPGIAAALVATVAGLAVAIPALFGYNYLGSKIKNVTADMHVFVDEYVSRLAESYAP